MRIKKIFAVIQTALLISSYIPADSFSFSLLAVPGENEITRNSFDLPLIKENENIIQANEFIDLEAAMQELLRKTKHKVAIRLTSSNGAFVERFIPDPSEIKDQGLMNIIYERYIARIYAQSNALRNGPSGILYVNAANKNDGIRRHEIEKLLIPIIQNYFDQLGESLYSKANTGNRVEVKRYEPFIPEKQIGIIDYLEQFGQLNEWTNNRNENDPIISISFDTGGNGTEVALNVNGIDKTEEILPAYDDESTRIENDESLRYMKSFTNSSARTGIEYEKRLHKFITEVYRLVKSKYGRVDIIFWNVAGAPDLKNNRMASLGALTAGLTTGEMKTFISKVNKIIPDLIKQLKEHGTLFAFGNDMEGVSVSAALNAGIDKGVVLFGGGGIGTTLLKNGMKVPGGNEGGHFPFYTGKEKIAPKVSDSPWGSIEDWGGSGRGIMGEAESQGVLQLLKKLGINNPEVKHIGLASCGINPLTYEKLYKNSELYIKANNVWEEIARRDAQLAMLFHLITGEINFAFGGGTAKEGTGAIRAAFMQKYVNLYSDKLNIPKENRPQIKLAKEVNNAEGAAHLGYLLVKSLLTQEQPVPEQSTLSSFNLTDNSFNDRTVAILAPVSCIGNLGNSARYFTDFLASIKATKWMRLPSTASQACYGDPSPYAPKSAFARDPSLIDLNDVPELRSFSGKVWFINNKTYLNELLDRRFPGKRRNSQAIAQLIYKGLKVGFSEFKKLDENSSRKIKFRAFIERERQLYDDDWLSQYSLFSALLDYHIRAPYKMSEIQKEKFEKERFNGNSRTVNANKLINEILKKEKIVEIKTITLEQLAFAFNELIKIPNLKQLLDDGRELSDSMSGEVDDIAIYNNKMELAKIYPFTLEKSLNKIHSWKSWDTGLKDLDESAIAKFRHENKDYIDFYCYEQFIADEALKNDYNYNHKRGISILGDMPIYTAANSADVFFGRDAMFMVDDHGTILKETGAPPDYFSEEGQNWGGIPYKINPRFKKYMLARIAKELQYVDELRIDHARWFQDFWLNIPGHKGIDGEWAEGLWLDFLKDITDMAERKGKRVFAENLGSKINTTNDLLKKAGISGMQVAVFAFNYGYPQYMANSQVADPAHMEDFTDVYRMIGTHDTRTWEGIWELMDQGQRRSFILYLADHQAVFSGLHLKFIIDRLENEKELPVDILGALLDNQLGSKAGTVVIPYWDLFGYGEAERINVPNKIGDWGLYFKEDPRILTGQRTSANIAHVEQIVSYLISGHNRTNKIFSQNSSPSMHRSIPDIEKNIPQTQLKGENFVVYCAVKGRKPEEVHLITNLPETSLSKAARRKVKMNFASELPSGLWIYEATFPATQTGAWQLNFEINGKIQKTQGNSAGLFVTGDREFSSKVSETKDNVGMTLKYNIPGNPFELFISNYNELTQDSKINIERTRTGFIHFSADKTINDGSKTHLNSKPGNKLASELGITGSTDEYFAFVDRDDGNVYIRSGKELLSNGMYFHLQPEAQHRFNVQKIIWNIEHARKLHDMLNGTSIGNSKDIALLKLKIDFLVYGKALEADLMQKVNLPDATEKTVLPQTPEALKSL